MLIFHSFWGLHQNPATLTIKIMLFWQPEVPEVPRFDFQPSDPQPDAMTFKHEFQLLIRATLTILHHVLQKHNTLQPNMVYFLLAMGPGQKFLPRSGWVNFLLLRLGQPSLVVVWKISPKNPKFFNFFPFH